LFVPAKEIHHICCCASTRTVIPQTRDLIAEGMKYWRRLIRELALKANTQSNNREVQGMMRQKP